MHLRFVCLDGLEFDGRIKTNLHAGGGRATGARGQVVEPQLAECVDTGDLVFFFAFGHRTWAQGHLQPLLPSAMRFAVGVPHGLAIGPPGTQVCVAQLPVGRLHVQVLGPLG